jgi:peptidyl-prolyl cis-trans isomerase C
MKLTGKVTATIVVLVALAGGALWAQRSSSSARTIKLSAHDMEVLVGEVLSPSAMQQLASNPDQRQQLVKEIKQTLALGQAAEREGYAQRPQMVSQIAMQSDFALRSAYQKKNPGIKVSDDEVNSYYQTNPGDFDNFIQSNPQFQAQAQGPQRDQIKREFGEIKVLAGRARQEGMEQDEVTKLRILLSRNGILASAYSNDLKANSDKLVSDSDVAGYLKEHHDEFEEVHARHILVSTKEPETPDGDDSADEAGGSKDAKGGKDGGDKAKKAKALTKEEAKVKAQSILDRVKKGEDFAKLAEQYSDDPGSKIKGGDLGYFSRGTMVAPFDQAAFSLKPGEVSGLVESDFGVHIIRVEDHRDADPNDPKTHQKVADKLKQDKYDQLIERIVSESSVQVAEDFKVTPKSAEPS